MQFPNSYHNNRPTTAGTPGFMPAAAEAPMQVASNVLSRVGHYRHEGDPSDYDQVRELYLRVLSPEKRANLHSNTAKLLEVRCIGRPCGRCLTNVVQKAEPIVQKNYLVQLHAIDPSYCKAIFDMLPAHDGYTLNEIAEKAKTAHMVNKNPQFMSKGKGLTFMGMSVNYP
jgi:catalase